MKAKLKTVFNGVEVTSCDVCNEEIEPRELVTCQQCGTEVCKACLDESPNGQYRVCDACYRVMY